MNRHKLTQEERRRGGLAVKSRRPPEYCPECGQPMGHRKWHSYLGHRGLHGLANAYFMGDLAAAQRHLRRNGQARQDPAPWNGALPRYVPLEEAAQCF